MDTGVDRQKWDKASGRILCSRYNMGVTVTFFQLFFRSENLHTEVLGKNKRYM